MIKISLDGGQSVPAVCKSLNEPETGVFILTTVYSETT